MYVLFYLFTENNLINILSNFLFKLELFLDKIKN